MAYLVKTVEDLLAFGRCNADARVGNHDIEHVVDNLRADFDTATLGGELDSIGKQVEDDLGECLFVEPELVRFRDGVGVGQLDVACLGEVEHRVAEIL